MKRLVSLFLCIALLFSVVPTMAFAANNSGDKDNNFTVSLSSSAPDSKGIVEVTVAVSPVQGKNVYLTNYTLTIMYDKTIVAPDLDNSKAHSKSGRTGTTYYGVSTDGATYTSNFNANVFEDNGKNYILATDTNNDGFNSSNPSNGFSVTFYFELTETAKTNGGNALFTLSQDTTSNNTAMFTISSAIGSTDYKSLELNNAVSVSVAIPSSNVPVNGTISAELKGNTTPSVTLTTNDGFSVDRRWSPELTDGKFVAGKTYTLTVTVSEGGGKFANGATVTADSSLGLSAFQKGTSSDGVVYYSATRSFVIPDKTLSKIEITTPPTKTAYKYGETFDPTGMVVKATYDDESVDENFTDYTFEPSGALAMNNTSIQVKADGKSATQPITMSRANNPAELTANSVNVKVGQRLDLAQYVRNVDSKNLLFTNTGTYPSGSTLESGSSIFAAGDTTGSTTIKITAQATTDYDVKELNLTVNVVEKDPQTNFKFAQTTQTKTYGDSDFTVKPTGNVTGSNVTYQSSNPDVATVDNTGKVHIVSASTAPITITATAAETADYAQATASYTLTVNKANATFTAPKAVSGLVYSKEAQALVTAGTTSDGEMQYATSLSGPFSATIPTGTDAGTYTVYYMVVGDANHNNTNVQGPVNVTIAKANNTVAFQNTNQATVKFNNTLGLSQFVIEAVGDVTYAITGSNLGSKVEGSTFTAGTTAGTVNVKVTAAGNANYNKGELTLPVTVVAKDPQSNFKFAEATQTKTYGNASFTVTATGAESGSSVTYASSDTSVATVNETTGAVIILKAGETTITATASETEAYAQATASYVLTVNKAAPGLNQPTAVSGLGYTGEAKALVNAGSTEDGTMQYALGQDSENAPTTGYQAAVPTGTDAGTYFVWYKVVGDENHSDSTPACVANISIAKADRNLSVDKESLTLTPASQADDGKVTLSYNDLDKSAKVSSSLSSQAVKVSSSEKDYTFTAQSNGNATATFTIPETKNYNASDTKTVTITSVSEAVTDVTASIKEPLAGGKDAVSAALSDDGKSIEVIGMKADNSEIVVTATPAVQGWSATQDGDKLIVKDANGNEVATYNIVDKTEALPDNAANVNVSSQDANAAVKADENDLKAAVSAQINEDLKDTPNASANVDPGITTTTDETKPNEKKVTLAPTYKTDPGAEESTPITDFAGKVKMTMNLPDNFVPTSVTQDGKALDFTVNESTNPKTVIWYQDKPGEVTLTADDRTGFITYNKADGSSVTLPYTAADLEKALETDSKKNNTFNGWTFDGIEGTFKTLKDAVLSAMNTADNKTLIATPLFTPDSSGNNGGGGGGAVPAAPVSVTNPDNGKVTLSPSSPKAGDTVTVTPTPDQGYKTDKVTVTDSKGNQVPVTKNEDGTYTFTVPKSNTPVKVNASFVKDDSGEKPDQNLKFVDVPKDAYYFDAVYWAVDQGITSGTSETTFSPDAPCTRAQAVTFLWRAAGEPTPASTENPFTDVKSDDYFYNAVLWAVEKGITKGTSATTFSPNDTVIRGQMVTFMYRAAGEPAVSQSNPFTDVAANAYYLNAVLWAVKENITSGTSATTFSPNADCLRSQIVTFLYRDAQ